MSMEDRLRDVLEAAPPTALTPPADLADTVLHRRRRERRTAVVAGIAVAVAVAVAVPLLVLRGPAGRSAPVVPAPSVSAEPEELPFVRPGGGPMMIFAYSVQINEGRAVSYLLNKDTGRYERVGFRHVWPAPGNPGLVAVQAMHGRIGVAGTGQLFTNTDIRWLDVPDSVSAAVWSPDGKALLMTSTYNDGPANKPPALPLRMLVHRWDVATGRMSSIAAPANATAVGWAADSQQYVALTVTRDSARKQSGVLQYLRPDGSLGQRVPVDAAGYVGGPSSYSPSRRLMVAWSPQAGGVWSVLEVATGHAVRVLPAGAAPVGWYDEQTVVTRSTAGDGKTPQLQLFSLATGRAVRTIPLAGLPENIGVELYPSAWLPPAYASLGF